MCQRHEVKLDFLSIMTSPGMDSLKVSLIMFSSPAHVLPLPEFRNGIQLFNRENIQKSFHDAFNFTTASCSDPAYLVVVQEHDVGSQPHPRYVGLAVGGGRVVQARSLTITGREPM